VLAIPKDPRHGPAGRMHHADPACARHGADGGQIHLSARLIRGLA
jgi:hypothetical protein